MYDGRRGVAGADAGVPSEPSVHLASQIGSGSGSAPPPYDSTGGDFDYDGFDLAAHLKSPEFEWPTPEVDAWVDSDDVGANQAVGSTTDNAVVRNAAVDYTSPFNHIPFFVRVFAHDECAYVRAYTVSA